MRWTTWTRIRESGFRTPRSSSRSTRIACPGWRPRSTGSPAASGARSSSPTRSPRSRPGSVPPWSTCSEGTPGRRSTSCCSSTGDMESRWSSMFVIRLADGTLRVPQSLTSSDGRLIGNAYVEIPPGDPDYDRWVSESITEEEEAERRQRWQEENDDLEREFLAFKAEQD